MTRVAVESITQYLQAHALPGHAGPYTVSEQRPEGDEQRFSVTSAAGVCTVKWYEPSTADTARREVAGLRLGGEIGLAPALLLADDATAPLGGSLLAFEEPDGKSLAGGRLSAEDAQSWLFLLLTLHHLPTARVEVLSSMSADAASWWQRTQPAWERCRNAYRDARYAPLLDALARLHAIVGVHIQAHEVLWLRAIRRPCHGNPVPAHVVRTARGLVLTEWSGFGQGDPAMEVGRVGALSALSGELSAEQYVRFVTDYLAGMRDTRDETLEERLRVFASILPLGFCFVVLDHLAQGPARAEDAAHIRQVERALVWIQDTLGVNVGAAAELLAPLRVPA